MNGDLTPGKRVELVEDEYNLQPGEYGKNSDGWFCKCPTFDPGFGGVGGLSNHTVIEHEDGTITVSPSILSTFGSNGQQWHGFLERGIWREV